MSAGEQLTRLQMEILEFERASWNTPGRRDAAILERFGHPPIRHTQIVNHLIDLEAALAYDPVLVNRLRARRDQHRTARARGSW